MSGCYMLFLSYPRLLSFLVIIDFSGIFLYACSIFWCLLFYFRSHITYCQYSSFNHHQSYRLIINQQSLPMHSFIIGTSVHYHNYCKILPSIRAHLNSYLLSATSHLNLYQILPTFHCILECTSRTPDNTLLDYNLGASAELTPF